MGLLACRVRWMGVGEIHILNHRDVSSEACLDIKAEHFSEVIYRALIL